jgi:hypothetical protein
MHRSRSTTQETAEDLYHGQVVISWARWFVIGAAVVLVIWTTTDVDKLVVGILPVIALMAINFYLHGRHLAAKPANRALITLASLLDLAVITVVVLVWPDQQGLRSQFFIMYYPVVLAFAFVMPPRIAAVYTAAALAGYAGACFAADPDVFANTHAVELLVTRLITLGAMGGLGTYYWRVQRGRRHAAMGEPAEVRGRQPGF